MSATAVSQWHHCNQEQLSFSTVLLKDLNHPLGINIYISISLQAIAATEVGCVLLACAADWVTLILVKYNSSGNYQVQPRGTAELNP